MLGIKQSMNKTKEFLQMQPTKEIFLKNVENHKMNILKDDNLYRHLYFSNPNDASYHFELITFPNRLIVTGDMGTYVFERKEDMFDFFRNPSLKINEYYFAEKAIAEDTSSKIFNFSKDKAMAFLKEEFDGWLQEQNITDKEQIKEFTEEFKTEFLDNCNDELEFYSLFSTKLDSGFSISFCEQNINEFNYHFIWCLYSIVWGINIYYSTKTT